MIFTKILTGIGVLGLIIFLGFVELFISAMGFSLFKSLSGLEDGDLPLYKEILIGIITGNLLIIVLLLILYLLGSLVS